MPLPAPPPMAAPAEPPPAEPASPASSRSGYSIDASSHAPSTWGDEEEQITDITEEVLDLCTGGKRWRVQAHRHMTFRSARFKLWSLDGLLLAPIDLSGLESLDVSNNQMKDLECIAGTSEQLKKERCIQGQLRFQSLRVLKARRNKLETFEAAMPSLKELDLGHNRLTKLPGMAGLSNLEVLVLSHNQLKGSWESLGRLQKLKKLDLSDNHFAFKPTEFGEQLETIKCLHHLVSLRLKDNLFAKTTAQGGCFPEYQTYTLQQMKHQLNILDDVVEKEDFAEAVQMASLIGDLDLQEYDIMVWQRQKLVGDRKDKGDHKNQKGENDLPTWNDLADALNEGVEDASVIPKTVKQVVRFANQIANADSLKVKSDLWKRNNHGKLQDLDPKEVESQIESFLQNFKVIIGRLETDKSRRLMLLRSLAKLTSVPENITSDTSSGLGSKCMHLLGFLMKRSPEAELEVLGVVKEIIIEPLTAKQKVQDLPLSTMTALSAFESGRLAEFLEPIVKWLVDMYKKAGSTEQIVHLLAVATSHPQHAKASVDVSSQNNLPCQVVKELDDNKILGPGKRDLYMGHLKILRNTALVSNQAVDYYKEKRIHSDLIKNLHGVFTDKGDTGTDLNQALTKKFDPSGGGGTRTTDQSGPKELRTCSHILEAASALMQKNTEILLEVVDSSFGKDNTFLGFLRVVHSASPVTDPALLAATLGCYDTILRNYPKDKVAGRAKIVGEIIRDLAKMVPMLELMDYNSNKFRQLFDAAEVHMASLNSENVKKAGGGRSTSQAPRFCNMRNPIVHRCLASVVALVEFFTAEGKNDRQCDEVSDVMNQKERETLLFKLLEVPSLEVQNAVMKCVQHVGADDMSEEDTAYLIKLLDNDKNIASEGPIFEKVIMQMNLLANAQGGLLKKLAERCVFAIVRVMHVNAHRNTYGAESVEHEKHALSQTCVQFLQTASRDKDLRHPHLRTKYVNRSIVEILKKEDELNGPEDPDIDVECTWTGRNIETLLTCLSGQDRLHAQGKVAFRVIARIADVLEGWSDMPQPQEKKEETKVCSKVEQVGERESAMWKYEQQLRAQLARLDDIERDDRFSQQLLFSNYEGVDRLVSFLNGLFEECEEGEQRTATMVQETATMKTSKDFMDSAVLKAQKRYEDEVKNQAITQQQQQQQQLQLTGKEESSSDEGEDEYEEGKEAPCIEFEGGEFSGLPNEQGIDLRKAPTFFQGTLGGAMSLSFVARWDACNKWSTVLDFGSGKPQDNVKISNQGTTNNLVFEIYDGKDSSKRLTVPGLIQLGETHCYLFTVSAAGHMRIWCDGRVVGEKSNGRAPKFNRRRELYVGTSHWEHWDHFPFQGSITDVKVWQGSVVDWGAVDLDSCEKAEEQPDRQLLMKVFMELPPKERLEKPMLKGIPGGSTSGSSKNMILEQLYVDIKAGRVNAAYLVAAVLRCCYAVLKNPAAEMIRRETVKRLHDPLKVGRLLSLTALCTPFDCNVAAKLLRVLAAALELGPSETEVPKERLVLFDQVARSMPEICRITVSALQQQDNPELHMRGKVLSAEVVGFASAVSRTVPFCDVFENKAVKFVFTELCFERLLPLTLVQAIIRILSSYSKPGDGQDPTSAEEETQLWNSSRAILAQLLEFCNENMKYNILEVFSTVQVSGTAALRPSFLSSLLLQSQQNNAQAKMETFLAQQQATPALRPKLVSHKWHTGTQRAILSAKVQVVINGKLKRVTSLKHAECCFICLVTNQAVHIIDATAPGYPNQPLIIDVRYFSDMTRLVRGCTEQVLTIGWGIEKGSDQDRQPIFHEDFMTLVCHCEADRNGLLTKLHALSEPPDGKPKHRVPVQSDVAFSKALENQVSEGGNPPLLNTFVFSDGNLSMFTLSEQSLFNCTINFEYWFPPSDDDQDGAADVKDDESGNKPVNAVPTPGGASAGGSEGAGTSAEDIEKTRRKARNYSEGNPEFTRNIQKLDQLVQPTPWPLQHLTRVTFYPDKRPRMGLAFGHEVISMLFLDDMSRETWRKTLLAQLSRLEEGATWARSYEGAGTGMPGAG